MKDINKKTGKMSSVQAPSYSIKIPKEMQEMTSMIIPETLSE
jgi:hypothetical protein